MKCWFITKIFHVQLNFSIVNKLNFVIRQQIICLSALSMKFSTKDFPSRCDQICRELQILSHSPKKSQTENLIFCTVLSQEKDWNKNPKMILLSSPSTVLHHNEDPGCFIHNQISGGIFHLILL